MPHAVVAVVFGLFGLVVGSFLNVCVYRLPRRESVVWPGSKCTSCLRSLLWFENVPVLSWLVLRGRCRTCKTSISMMYPGVELATGLAFAGSYLVYGMQPLLVVRIAFACAMIVLFAIDYRHRILPDVITLPGILVGFATSLILPPGPVASLMGLVAGGGSLFLINEAYYRLRGQEGLGMGDVKMLAMIGAFLGWKLMVVTLFLGSFTGSILGLLLISFRKGSMQSALPFGTFLALGALAATVIGDRLIAWYISITGLPL
jgi:leader peptidase (prepilin peptidase) / N-methyltransferase